MTKRIGMYVHYYDGHKLEIRADLDPNINIHGTAFGGSLYSVGSLAGWGLLILKLEESDLDPRIMIRAGEIEYMKPVMQTICATGIYQAPLFEQFVQEYNDKKKARIKVPVEIRLNNGQLAANFTGDYVAFDRTAS